MFARRVKMEPYKLHVCGCISRYCRCSHRNGGDYWCSQYQCQYGPQLKQSKGLSRLRKIKARVKHKEVNKESIPLVVQQREAQDKVMENLKRKWAMEGRAAPGAERDNYDDFTPSGMVCSVHLDPQYDSTHYPTDANNPLQMRYDRRLH